MLVDASPVLSVHDVEEAPEDLLLILNVHQQHACDVVHTLNVPDLRIVIAVSKEDVVEHLLTFFTLPVKTFVLALQVL